MFITFEGIDYSGKSTQAVLLVTQLQASGSKVILLREPGGTPVSEAIRTILLDKQHLEMGSTAELLLFSAARAQLVQQVICPALREGTVVVCDRYYDSTTAYQGYGRGIALDEIRAINRIASSGTTPDVTLLVDVGVEEVVQRRLRAGLSADRMEASGNHFFERVRAGYRQIALEEPQRVKLVDGMRPIEPIRQEIWSIVQEKRSLIGG